MSIEAILQLVMLALTKGPELERLAIQAAADIRGAIETTDQTALDSILHDVLLRRRAADASLDSLLAALGK